MFWSALKKGGERGGREFQRGGEGDRVKRGGYGSLLRVPLF